MDFWEGLIEVFEELWGELLEIFEWVVNEVITYAESIENWISIGINKLADELLASGQKLKPNDIRPVILKANKFLNENMDSIPTSSHGFEHKLMKVFYSKKNKEIISNNAVFESGNKLDNKVKKLLGKKGAVMIE